MAWTLGGVTINVDRDSQTVESNYAIQDVLDATASITSWFGSPSDKRTLDFTLSLSDSGATGLTTLKAAAKADANVALTSDQGAEGNYRILRLTPERVQATNKALPVYKCSVDLILV
jgi:hypothetical protein